MWKRLVGDSYPAMAAVGVARLWDEKALVEMQGYAIYRLVRALPEEPRTDVQKTSDAVNAHRLAGAQQFEAWLAAERERAKIEVNRANLEKK